MAKDALPIDHLAPADALAILRTLAARDQEMARRIAELALEYLGETDPEAVAFHLYNELEALKVEEV